MKIIYRLQSATGIMSTHMFNTFGEAQDKANFLNFLTSYKWHVVTLYARGINMTLKKYENMTDYEQVMLWWEYNAANNEDIDFTEFDHIMRDSLNE